MAQNSTSTHPTQSVFMCRAFANAFLLYCTTSAQKPVMSAREGLQFHCLFFLARTLHKSTYSRAFYHQGRLGQWVPPWPDFHLYSSAARLLHFTGRGATKMNLAECGS